MHHWKLKQHQQLSLQFLLPQAARHRSQQSLAANLRDGSWLTFLAAAMTAIFQEFPESDVEFLAYGVDWEGERSLYWAPGGLLRYIINRCVSQDVSGRICLLKLVELNLVHIGNTTYRKTRRWHGTSLPLRLFTPSRPPCWRSIPYYYRHIYAIRIKQFVVHCMLAKI